MNSTSLGLSGRFATIAAVLAFGISGLANGAIVVAPNANTSTSGNNLQFGILGSSAGTSVTFQTAFDSSQFSTVAVGSMLEGIGFRLPAGAATISTDLNYTSYSIEVATAAVPVGSLTTTFANNESADNTIVRSGSLSIPAGSFVGGAGPNPFYEIAFTTPFTYSGGSLVVTIRRTYPGAFDSVDADTLGAGVQSNIGNTVANFASDTATTADSGGPDFYNVPIVSFDFVPEPTTAALLGIGVVMMGFGRRRRVAV